MVEVQFIFVWCFWQKVVEQIGTELINKGKGKEERNKIHCKERKGKRMQQTEFLSNETTAGSRQLKLTAFAVNRQN